MGTSLDTHKDASIRLLDYLPYVLYFVSGRVL
jgi:hypothetical protein